MKISLSLHKIYYIRASLRQDLPEKTPTDKSNAIKTVINFLSFVKPLKTGTNYTITSFTFLCLTMALCYSIIFKRWLWPMALFNRTNDNFCVMKIKDIMYNVQD
jgi:hypothetical protein